MASLSKDGLLLRAKVITGVDAYWELFDDNLPEIGIVAVWVSMDMPARSDLSLVKARWRLRTPSGTFKPLTVSQVLKRYYRARGIRIYGQNADALANRGLQRISLTNRKLQPGMECSGFLFFQIPPARNLSWESGPVLILENIRQNGERQADLELIPSHAKP